MLDKGQIDIDLFGDLENEDAWVLQSPLDVRAGEASLGCAICSIDVDCISTVSSWGVPWSVKVPVTWIVESVASVSDSPYTRMSQERSLDG
jgi:hypothetical protein